LDGALKKRYKMVYNQCMQKVKDKLEATNDWDKTQRDQLLDKLIQKIECICVGFDDHKQEVFNLVQTLKMLFLYTHGEREGVEEYGRNFKSLWDMVEAFGGSPGVHKGLVEGLLLDVSQVWDANNVTRTERVQNEQGAFKAVKAAIAMLISRADKHRYGKLTDELANNYLLGTDQYSHTLQGSTYLGQLLNAQATSHV
jgi:hypothetical protein